MRSPVCLAVSLSICLLVTKCYNFNARARVPHMLVKSIKVFADSCSCYSSCFTSKFKAQLVHLTLHSHPLSHTLTHTHTHSHTLTYSHTHTDRQTAVQIAKQTSLKTKACRQDKQCLIVDWDQRFLAGQELRIQIYVRLHWEKRSAFKIKKVHLHCFVLKVR